MEEASLAKGGRLRLGAFVQIRGQDPKRGVCWLDGHVVRYDEGEDQYCIETCSSGKKYDELVAADEVPHRLRKCKLVEFADASGVKGEGLVNRFVWVWREEESRWDRGTVLDYHHDDETSYTIQYDKDGSIKTESLCGCKFQLLVPEIATEEEEKKGDEQEPQPATSDHQEAIACASAAKEDEKEREKEDEQQPKIATSDHEQVIADTSPAKDEEEEEKEIETKGDEQQPPSTSEHQQVAACASAAKEEEEETEKETKGDEQQPASTCDLQQVTAPASADKEGEEKEKEKNKETKEGEQQPPSTSDHQQVIAHTSAAKEEEMKGDEQQPQPSTGDLQQVEAEEQSEVKLPSPSKVTQEDTAVASPTKINQHETTALPAKIPQKETREGVMLAEPAIQQAAPRSYPTPLFEDGSFVRVRYESKESGVQWIDGRVARCTTKDGCLSYEVESVKGKKYHTEFIRHDDAPSRIKRAIIQRDKEHKDLKGDLSVNRLIWIHSGQECKWVQGVILKYHEEETYNIHFYTERRAMVVDLKDRKYKLLQPVELESEVPADSAGQKKEEKPAMAEVREAEREKQERNRTRASRQNSPKPKVEPAPPSSSGEKKRKAGKEPNMKKDSARRVSTRKPGSGGVTGGEESGGDQCEYTPGAFVQLAYDDAGGREWFDAIVERVDPLLGIMVQTFAGRKRYSEWVDKDDIPSRLRMCQPVEDKARKNLHRKKSINRLIWVYWPYERTWFRGIILDYLEDEAIDTYRIYYDDNTFENECLHDSRYKLLQPCNGEKKGKDKKKVEAGGKSQKEEDLEEKARNKRRKVDHIKPMEEPYEPASSSSSPRATSSLDGQRKRRRSGLESVSSSSDKKRAPSTSTKQDCSPIESGCYVQIRYEDEEDGTVDFYDGRVELVNTKNGFLCETYAKVEGRDIAKRYSEWVSHKEAPTLLRKCELVVGTGGNLLNGKKSINRRIWVWWPREGQYFEGVITNYHRGNYTIFYFTDKTTETENLDGRRYKMLVPIAGSADDDHKGEGQEEEGDKENYKDQKRHKGATHHHHDGKATGESSSSSSDATQRNKSSTSSSNHLAAAAAKDDEEVKPGAELLGKSVYIWDDAINGWVLGRVVGYGDKTHAHSVRFHKSGKTEKRYFSGPNKCRFHVLTEEEERKHATGESNEHMTSTSKVMAKRKTRTGRDGDEDGYCC